MLAKKKHEEQFISQQLSTKSKLNKIDSKM